MGNYFLDRRHLNFYFYSNPYLLYRVLIQVMLRKFARTSDSPSIYHPVCADPSEMFETFCDLKEIKDYYELLVEITGTGAAAAHIQH